jgi:hypothetical protein
MIIHVPRTRFLLLIAITVLFLSTQMDSSAQNTLTALPEDNAGLAARYPGDINIAKDPKVIFVENFEIQSTDELKTRWESVQQLDIMSLDNDTPQHSAGTQSLLITHTGGQGTGGQLYRRLQPGYDKVFARFNVKFDPDCAQIHHFGTHMGGFNPSTPWPQGGAGVRPDGAKRFTSSVEPHGTNWVWDFYSYWQGMRVHGDGNYWGTPFLSGVSKPQVEKGKWICVELMLSMNQPPEDANGEQAFWINGKLWKINGQTVSHVGPGFPKGKWAGGWWQPDHVSDTAFEGFQWRTVQDLAINYIWTYVYITKAPQGHVSKIWFDDIVVATEYIGPLSPQKLGTPGSQYH